MSDSPNPFVKSQLGDQESFSRTIDQATGNTKQQRLDAINEKIEHRKDAYIMHLEKLKQYQH